jgi:hypothetical protein
MKIEPTADMRRTADAMYQLYLAYTQAGFTDDQAFQLVKIHAQDLVHPNTPQDTP